MCAYGELPLEAGYDPSSHARGFLQGLNTTLFILDLCSHLLGVWYFYISQGRIKIKKKISRYFFIYTKAPASFTMLTICWCQEEG